VVSVKDDYIFKIVFFYFSIYIKISFGSENLNGPNFFAT